MKVVHLITKIGRGGAPMMLYKLLKQFKKDNKNEHIILGLREENKLSLEFEELGIKAKTLGFKKNPLSIKKFLQLQKILRKLSPDLIHSWMYHSNVLASLSSGRCKIVWSTHHSLDDLNNEKRLTQYFIKAGPYLEKTVSKHVYCSKTSKEQHEGLGYSSERSLVIPNGFDIEEFYPNYEKRSQFRKKYKIPADGTVFGQAARFHPLKNQEWLIKVFAEAQKINSDAYLVMAGDGIDKKNSKLIKLINELNLNGKVSLIGECKDMPGFYNAIDFYCSSSLSEAFPMVLGEAMACGTPCIGTDVGDTSFIIGEHGWVVSLTDERKYIESMVEMIGLGDKEYDQIATAARKRIKDKFSLESVATLYNGLYVNAINN